MSDALLVFLFFLLFSTSPPIAPNTSLEAGGTGRGGGGVGGAGGRSGVGHGRGRVKKFLENNHI